MKNLTATEIEAMRKTLREHTSWANDLCALALDGLLFRAWIKGCKVAPADIARALGPCTEIQQFRAAITRLVALGRIRP